jgi:hypothetical protein
MRFIQINEVTLPVVAEAAKSILYGAGDESTINAVITNVIDNTAYFVVTIGISIWLVAWTSD